MAWLCVALTLACACVVAQARGPLMWAERSSREAGSAVSNPLWTGNFDAVMRYADYFSHGALQALAVWAVFSSAPPVWRIVLFGGALALHAELDQFGGNAGVANASIVIYLLVEACVFALWGWAGAAIIPIPNGAELRNITRPSDRSFRFSTIDILCSLSASAVLLASARRYVKLSYTDTWELSIAIPILIAQAALTIWIVLSRDGVLMRAMRLFFTIVVVTGMGIAILMLSTATWPVRPVNLGRHYADRSVFMHSASYWRPLLWDFTAGSAVMLAPLLISLLVARHFGFSFAWRANRDVPSQLPIDGPAGREPLSAV